MALDRIHGADYFEDGINKKILVDWLCTRLLTILICQLVVADIPVSAFGAKQSLLQSNQRK